MKIYEIGAGYPVNCKTANDTENECWLFEPNPLIYKDLIFYNFNFKCMGQYS